MAQHAREKLYRIDTADGPRDAVEDGADLVILAAPPFGGIVRGETRVAKAAATLLAPVEPTKIVAVGLNYRDHAKERNKPIPAEPLLFLKPSTAVIGPGATIRRPTWAGRVDHEAELGIVIGRTCHDLPSPDGALEYVLGAVCANDVTARELQDKDVQFTRGKGFDTFCPLGPCIATGLDYTKLAVTGRVNGTVRQHSTTAELIFPVEYLVWAVARVMTLHPGDVIITGTPAGIGPLTAGDVVEVEVEGVGILSNPVA